MLMTRSEVFRLLAHGTIPVAQQPVRDPRTRSPLRQRVLERIILRAATADAFSEERFARLDAIDRLDIADALSHVYAEYLDEHLPC